MSELAWGQDEKSMKMAKNRVAGSRKIYGVHPGVQMVRDWIDSLPAKTGRSLEQWLALIKKEGPPNEKERRDWLKQEHGLGTNAALWMAERADGKGSEEDTPEGYLKAAATYVEAMFAGNKAGLRPLYERVLAIAASLGTDVKACPCQTIVPLYRKHVFAQLKPSTRTRLDLGFALRDLPAEGRLIDTGGFAKKDRITHRMPLSAESDIDKEVERWLKRAYDLDV
jgi:Domain of unknown function (DUF5655)/Domain of unknown function (DUF4287)